MPESMPTPNLAAAAIHRPAVPGRGSSDPAPGLGQMSGLFAVLLIGLAAIAALYQARINDPMMQCGDGRGGVPACSSAADAGSVRFGADAVQVIASDRVYVCPSDRAARRGGAVEVMSEIEANARGFRPAAGKPCN